MSFDRINRRTHLYLGLLLAPWFLLYALSSVVLNHGEFFAALHDNRSPEWTKRFERPYRLPPITDDSDPWELGEKILKDQGLTGRYRAHFDDDGNLVVVRNRFLTPVRFTYYPEEGKLVAEDKVFRLDQALTAAHFRAGFEQPYNLEILWGVVVDALALSTLLWIVSGLYIWLRLKRLRFWGWVSLAGGTASFVLVVLQL